MILLGLIRVQLKICSWSNRANRLISITTRAFHYNLNDSAVVTVTEDHDLAPAQDGAGALIGTLERVISFALLISGQIAVIGLIFTAKSIARFDRIQKDQRFAEYYLIGSLSSLIICVVVSAFVLVLR